MHAKILDFGLAKVTIPAGRVAEGSNCDDTRESAGRRAPHQSGSDAGHGGLHVAEQARGRELDARTDLFSFGATLYEMVTGTTPFRGQGSGDMRSVLRKAPNGSGAAEDPEVPSELERIISKALEKDRDLRYPARFGDAGRSNG